MSKRDRKDTPPLSFRFQKSSDPHVLSIGRLQNIRNKRDDHLLSISPWLNEDTNLNGRSSRNSSRGIAQRNQLRKQITTNHGQNNGYKIVNRQIGASKRKQNYTGLKPCLTGRCHTQNIYIDDKHPKKHINEECIDEDFNEKSGRITLRMKTLQIVDHSHFNYISPDKNHTAFLPNYKYRSEQVTERKMSLNKFRSPSPAAFMEKKSGGRKRKNGENNKVQKKKDKQIKEESIFNKNQQIYNEQLARNKNNYYNFEETKVLIQKKLTTDPSVFNKSNKKYSQNSKQFHRVWEPSKKNDLIQKKMGNRDGVNELHKQKQSLIFYMQARAKNNIMGRQRNIMKLRNLVGNSRTSKGKKMKTDGIQHI